MPGIGSHGSALTARAAASAFAKPPARSTASPSRLLFNGSIRRQYPNQRPPKHGDAMRPTPYALLAPQRCAGTSNSTPIALLQSPDGLDNWFASCLSSSVFLIFNPLLIWGSPATQP